jgi:hypothetical protein
MATQLQIRRGTSAQVAAFTGAEGEVVVNTTNDSIHVNDGSTAGGFELARVDGSNWAITNNISTTANISFGDNDKAIFGAGSDLQIFHNGTESFIREVGEGGLKIDTNGPDITFRVNATETALVATSNGAVTAYYDNAQKFATTSTGIDVTGNATFADNGKAIFGAGSDLQIYHDGSASYISDQGTGTLKIQGDSQVRLESTAGERYFVGTNNGAARLYYDDTEKLATTATGIDVTGTVTADGLTVDGNGAFTGKITINRSGVLTRGIEWNRSGTIDAAIKLHDDEIVKFDNFFNGRYQFRSGASGSEVIRLDIATGGDIRFYNSAGTSQSLFWDASAESLGIGTTSPSRLLHINSAGVQIGALIESTSTASARLALANANTTSESKVGIGAIADDLVLYAGGAQAVTVDDSGNVGIGTSSPSRNLDIQGTGDTLVSIVSPATNQAALFFGDTDSDSVGRVAYDNSDNSMRFNTNGSEAMRIDSSGNLLVGMTSGTSSDRVQISVTDGVINGVGCYATTTAGGDSLVNRNSADTYVGGVSYTNTATSFPTSSDQRLKENIADAPSASNDIDAIQVRSFDWKADGSHQDYGMIAQELQAVAPEAVTGDADSDEMMGVDYSKLVPMLVKEIQSLRARVAQLEN